MEWIFWNLNLKFFSHKYRKTKIFGFKCGDNSSRLQILLDFSFFFKYFDSLYINLNSTNFSLGRRNFDSMKKQIGIFVEQVLL